MAQRAARDQHHHVASLGDVAAAQVVVEGDVPIAQRASAGRLAAHGQNAAIETHAASGGFVAGVCDDGHVEAVFAQVTSGAASLAPADDGGGVHLTRDEPCALCEYGG